MSYLSRLKQIETKNIFISSGVEALPELPKGGSVSYGSTLPPQINKKNFAIDAVTYTETLAQFRFDLVEQAIEEGHPAEELRRVNNIAWRLITARGYQFQEAITTAAQWVVDNPPHRDEAAFIDVMELFKRNQH